MSDKDWILLAIGCSIGLATSFGVFYLVLLVEALVEGWRDARKRMPSRSGREPAWDEPTPLPEVRPVLYAYVSLVVSMLSKFLGGIVARFLMGRLDARKRTLSGSGTEPARDVQSLPPKEHRGLYGSIIVVVFVLSSFFGAVAARGLLGW